MTVCGIPSSPKQADTGLQPSFSLLKGKIPVTRLQQLLNQHYDLKRGLKITQYPPKSDFLMFTEDVHFFGWRKGLVANHWWRAAKTVHVLTSYIPFVIQASWLSKIKGLKKWKAGRTNWNMWFTTRWMQRKLIRKQVLINGDIFEWQEMWRLSSKIKWSIWF